MNIPFGELDGRLVHVSKVERGAACGCVCPVCRVPLVARKGASKAHHFAHESGSGCTQESLLHYLGKHIMRDRIDRAFRMRQPIQMQWKCVQCPDQHEGDLLRVSSGVRLEQSLGTCRPDLLLVGETGDPRVFVEIVVSHRPEDHVREYAARESISIVEIELKSVEDLEALASCETVRPASVDVCMRAKCQKCLSPVSSQLLFVVDDFCWKCHSATKVAVIDAERALLGPRYFTQHQLALAVKLGAFIQENYSRTMNQRYLSNTCGACGAMSGDHFLYQCIPAIRRKQGQEVGSFCWKCHDASG